MKDIRIYPAIFHFEETFINVNFPDLEGCFTFGDTLEEAINNSREVLEGWLYLMEKQNEEIPRPSNFSKIRIGDNQQLVLVKVDMKKVRQEEKGKE